MSLSKEDITIRVIGNNPSNTILSLLESTQTLLVGLASVIVSLIIVYINNKNNKKIENKKIKREKLEELHGLIYPLGNMFIKKREMIHALKYINLKDYYNQFYISKSRIIVLVNTYFHKELSVKNNELLANIDLIFSIIKLEWLKERSNELVEENEYQHNQLDLIKLRAKEYSPNDYTQYDIHLEETKQLDIIKSIVSENQVINEERSDIENSLKQRGNPDTLKLLEDFSEKKQKFLEDIINESNKTFK